MSWFWRGFQSAIFYYVSCAPCTKFAYQRRRRKDRRRANAEHEVEEGSYQHPSPFSTNMYWREEMLLGPGPPQKKKERDKEREKERENWNRGLGTGGSALTGASSADTMVGTEGVEGRRIEQERPSGEGWNKRRYQREDEILWGFDDDDHAHTSDVGISRARTSSSGGPYYFARNPEVNDLHPPIVNTPTNKSQTRWMLQPPPSARVMEGKERANRSRSDSGTSGRSNASSKRAADMHLGRRVGGKLMEDRIRRGEVAPTDSFPLVGTSSKVAPTAGPQGQCHDRECRLSSESRSTTTSQRKPPPPPLNISADLHSSASRLPLTTIASQTHVEQASERPQRPSLIPMDSTSSLHVPQELVSPLSLDAPPAGKLNTDKLYATTRSPPPLSEATIKLPPANVSEDQELTLPGVVSRFGTADGWAISPKEESGERAER